MIIEWGAVALSVGMIVASIFAEGASIQCARVHMNRPAVVLSVIHYFVYGVALFALFTGVRFV